jgi:hypothetical protein
MLSFAVDGLITPQYQPRNIEFLPCTDKLAAALWSSLKCSSAGCTKSRGASDVYLFQSTLQTLLGPDLIASLPHCASCTTKTTVTATRAVMMQRTTSSLNVSRAASRIATQLGYPVSLVRSVWKYCPEQFHYSGNILELKDTYR